MKFLKCKICGGNISIVRADKTIRIVECSKCGFTNDRHKFTEIFIKRKS